MDSKRCTTIDEASMADGSKPHGGVWRCRDMELTSSGSSKRRKFDFLDQDIVVQPEKHRRSGVELNSPAEPDAYDHVLSSPCFSDCLQLDLKVELVLEAESFMSGNGGFNSATSPSSDICLDLDKIESFSKMKKKAPPSLAVTGRRKPPSMATKGPTAAKIDEFFAVAEKKEQQRFSDKYNFDIVNDVPLDGRYQWVRLKP